MSSFLPKEPYRRAVYLVFYILLGTAAFYVFFKWLFPLLLPFAAAGLAAVLLHRPAAFVAKKAKVPTGVVAVFFVLLFLAVAVALFAGAVAVAANQLASFAGGLLERQNELFAEVQGTLDAIGDFAAKLPFFSGTDAAVLRARIREEAMGFLKSTVLTLSAKIPALIGQIASFVPQMLLSVAVTFLSAIYFSAGYDRMAAALRKKLSAERLSHLRAMYGKAGQMTVCLLKAYGLLFLLTFAELLLGLTVLRQKYALLLALLIAAVDILPVLGTGTVLVPWAVWAFFAGNPKQATGLLILYGVIAVVRQILEPRMVGAGIGLSPVLALLSMYVGLRLFGILGMLLLPPVLAVGKGAVTAFRRAAAEGEKP